MPEPLDVHPRQPQSTLATKIILFVFAATFVTALSVSITSIDAIHSQLRGFADRHYPVVAERAATELRRHLEAGRRELAALAGGPERPGSLPQSPFFAGYAWIDESGVALHRLGSAQDLDPSLWRELDRGSPLAALGSPPQLAAVHVPPRGGLAVVGLYQPETLRAHVEAVAPDPHAAALLVGPGGRVLAAFGGDPNRYPASLALPEAGPEVREYSNDRGSHVLGIVQPLGLGGLALAAETPFERAFAPMLTVVLRIFALDLTIVLLSSLLAYQVTTRVVKPIEVLSEGARRIGQGDLDLEIPETGSRDEVGLLTRTFNDMMRKLRRHQIELEERYSALQDKNEVLSQLSITDGLTQLHNHRFFQDYLTREIKRVARTGEPLSMLLIDIDDFKALNDQRGHAAGDELLAGLARIMGGCVRESDLLARYGGEEFVVLASNTAGAGATALAEKIRENVEEASFILDESMRPTRITVSIGVAEFRGNRKRFFEAADRALYRAKARGKNQVVTDLQDEPEEALAAEPEDPTAL